MVNNASVNIHVQVFLWPNVLNAFGLILGKRIARSAVTLYLLFWGTAKLFSTMATAFYISTKNVCRFQFLALSGLILCCWSLLGVLVMLEGEGVSCVSHSFWYNCKRHQCNPSGIVPTTSSFLLLLSLATVFSISLKLSLSLKHSCVFTLKWNKKPTEDCTGRNVLPPAEIKLWQFFPPGE